MLGYFILDIFLFVIISININLDCNHTAESISISYV